MEWHKIEMELPDDKDLHDDYVQGLNNLLIEFRKEGKKSNANLWFKYKTKNVITGQYGNNTSSKDVLYYDILVDNLSDHAVSILEDLGYSIYIKSMTRFERKNMYEKLKLNEFKI